jgi:hypothetical protein
VVDVPVPVVEVPMPEVVPLAFLYASNSAWLISPSLLVSIRLNWLAVMRLLAVNSFRLSIPSLLMSSELRSGIWLASFTPSVVPMLEFVPVVVFSPAPVVPDVSIVPLTPVFAGVPVLFIELLPVVEAEPEEPAPAPLVAAIAGAAAKHISNASVAIFVRFIVFSFSG